MKAPGFGNMGREEMDPQSPEGQARARWSTVESIEAYYCFSDPDFVRAFIASVSDPAEQEQYVKHTIRYLDGQQKDADPRYVLFFRRSLPSQQAKPEQHWTSDFVTAARGLRKEIAGAQRLHSVILCSRLADIMASGPEIHNNATSDGEVKVDNTAFDQTTCVCSYRPARQQRELEEYLQQTGAMTLEEITGAVRTEMQSRLNEK